MGCRAGDHQAVKNTTEADFPGKRKRAGNTSGNENYGGGKEQKTDPTPPDAKEKAMTSKIGNIIGKVNEAVGAMKANADHASVREDGKKQEELGRKQQADSADARKTERG